MKIAVIGVLIGIAIAVAVVLLDSGPGAPDAVDDKHKAAAILVARCDAAMSSLDLELGSGHSRSAAIASRIDQCTRAKAAVERAQAARSSHQLESALDRVTKHLEQLAAMAGSGAGSAPAPTDGRRTGLSPATH